MQHSFYHVTDMIPDDRETIVSLVQDMYFMRGNYLDFVGKFTDVSDHGVLIEFDPIDGDTFQEDLDVVKWRIEFRLHDEDVVRIKGHSLEEEIDVIDTSTNNVIFTGSLEAVIDYINSDESKYLTQEEINMFYGTNKRLVDRYQSYLKDIHGIKFEFRPMP